MLTAPRAAAIIDIMFFVGFSTLAMGPALQTRPVDVVAYAIQVATLTSRVDELRAGFREEWGAPMSEMLGSGEALETGFSVPAMRGSMVRFL